MNRILKVVALIMIGTIFFGLVAFSPLPTGPLGVRDLLPYWMAAYVFIQGDNPYSTAALDEAFRTVRPAEYAATDPVFRPPWALGPPWTLLVVAPLGMLPFEVVARLWLMLTLVMIGGAAIWVWRLLNGATVHGELLLPVLLALGFVPALIVIVLGQIVSLVLIGLVACLAALQIRRDALAGAALLLALSKPQLVYLAGPAILIWALWRRRWGVWLGLMVALVGALSVLTLLMPGWWADYLDYVRTYDFFRHAAATIGGVVSAYWNTDALRWVGVLALALLPLIVRLIDRRGALMGVNVALLISLPLAPYGWNYDHIVLIPAIIQAVMWLRNASPRRSRLLVAVLVIIYGALWAMRLRGAGEMLYVWVPIAIGTWYVAVYFACRREIDWRDGLKSEV